jgi:hypothetical protein
MDQLTKLGCQLMVYVTQVVEHVLCVLGQPKADWYSDWLTSISPLVTALQQAAGSRRGTVGSRQR